MIVPDPRRRDETPERFARELVVERPVDPRTACGPVLIRTADGWKPLQRIPLAAVSEERS